MVNVVRYTLSGAVRDSNGQAIPEASLNAISSKWIAGGSAVSDAHGRYSMTVPAGFQFVVKHPCFRDMSRSVSIQTDTSLDVTLVPGVNLDGRVADFGTQDRLDDAVVEVVSGPDAGRSFLTRRVGASNSYFFLDLVPGPFTIRAHKSGYEPVERRVDVTADTTVDFRLVKTN